MEIAAMGKVVVSARVENLQDLYDAERGNIPKEKVRAVEISEALVDTGATFLCFRENWCSNWDCAGIVLEPLAPHQESFLSIFTRPYV